MGPWICLENVVPRPRWWEVDLEKGGKWDFEMGCAKNSKLITFDIFCRLSVCVS